MFFFWLINHISMDIKHDTTKINLKDIFDQRLIEFENHFLKACSKMNVVSPKSIKMS